MNNKKILIIGEQTDGKLKASTLDLAEAGRTLADKDDHLVLALIGDNLDAICEEAATKTGLDVLYLRVPGLDHDNGEIYKTLIQSRLMTLSISHIIAAHSSLGAEYAPGLAVRLSAACITAVNGIERDDHGQALFSRGICGGNLNTVIRALAPRTVVTIQAGSFPARSHPGRRGRVIHEIHDVHARATRVIGIEQSRAGSSGLGQANVIVSAGRGIGQKENLEAIRRFAALFPHAAVGGSRPLIDMGWLEYKHQVGITGAVVSPDVYIACGISGSNQHIAGMNTAGFVVAINTDPHAAIFNVADLCIIDDLIGFIEAFETVVQGE